MGNQRKCPGVHSIKAVELNKGAIKILNNTASTAEYWLAFDSLHHMFFVILSLPVDHALPISTVPFCNLRVVFLISCWFLFPFYSLFFFVFNLNSSFFSSVPFLLGIVSAWQWHEKVFTCHLSLPMRRARPFTLNVIDKLMWLTGSSLYRTSSQEHHSAMPCLILAF